jgi:hypothetical protein
LSTRKGTVQYVQNFKIFTINLEFGILDAVQARQVQKHLQM